MSLTFLSLFTLFLSIVIIRYEYRKNKAGTIIFFFFASLFFVQIPLLFDVINYEIIFEGEANKYFAILNSANFKLLENYSIINQDLLIQTNVLVMLINVVTYLSYRVLKKSSNVNVFKRELFFSDWIYVASGILAFSLFFYMYGFDLIRIGLGYREDRQVNRFALLSFNFFLIGGISGILKKFIEKKYFVSIIFSLPISIIAIFTESRSLFIAVPFIIIFYFINKRLKVPKLAIRILVVIAVFLIVNSSLRATSFFEYPIKRDVAFYDLYYSIKNQEILYTGFSNFIRLVFTGFPIGFGNVYDITYKLADYRIGYNWGSLHPTFYGWLFIDSGWYAVLISAFFGLFMGLCDFIRTKYLKSELGLFFIPFQLSFIAVLVRGSLQYAYSNIIYVFILILIVNYFYRRSKHSIKKYKFIND